MRLYETETVELKEETWNLYNKKQKGSRIVLFDNGKIVKKGSYEF